MLHLGPPLASCGNVLMMSAWGMEHLHQYAKATSSNGKGLDLAIQRGCLQRVHRRVCTAFLTEAADPSPEGSARRIAAHVDAQFHDDVYPALFNPSAEVQVAIDLDLLPPHVERRWPVLAAARQRALARAMRERVLQDLNARTAGTRLQFAGVVLGGASFQHVTVCSVSFFSPSPDSAVLTARRRSTARPSRWARRLSFSRSAPPASLSGTSQPSRVRVLLVLCCAIIRH